MNVRNRRPRRTADIALANQLLPAFGDMPLDRIERKDVNRWFDRYSATAPGGANRALEVMHQILNHAKVHSHLEINPASSIPPQSGPQVQPIPLPGRNQSPT